MRKNSKQTKNNSNSLKIPCNLKSGTHYGLLVTDDDDDAGEIICNNCGVVLDEKTISYDIDSVNSFQEDN